MATERLPEYHNHHAGGPIPYAGVSVYIPTHPRRGEGWRWQGGVRIYARGGGLLRPKMETFEVPTLYTRL